MKAGSRPFLIFLMFLAYTCDALRESSHFQDAGRIEIRSLDPSELLPQRELFLPQKPRARAEMAVAGTPGNLMETDQLDGECSKEDEVWTLTGKELGRGHNVRVVEVQGQRHQGPYALKEPLTEDGVSDVKKEMTVMSASMTHRCSHVMSLTTEAPCVQTDSWYDWLFGIKAKKAAAFVAPKMEGDLFSWLKQVDKDLRLKCAEKIFQEAARGMHCLHSAGYIHGDLKGDNVFYKQLDAEGCPAGVVLADFGMSKKVGEATETYESFFYPGCSHLPDSVFAKQTDSLGIRVPGHNTSYYAMPKIDFCSLISFAFESFDLALKIPNSGIPIHGCGAMGKERQASVPVE